MKRILLLITVLLAIFVITGCGDNKAAQASQTQQQTAQQIIRFSLRKQKKNRIKTLVRNMKELYRIWRTTIQFLLATLTGGAICL